MRARVWVAWSKRNTPPKWISATSHTTSSVRSAVSTRSSPLPVATTTACSTSSSRLRCVSALSGAAGAGAGVDGGRARPGRSSDAPPPRSERETAAIPTAPDSAATSERAHQSQRRRAGPWCSRAGSKVQRLSPPSPSCRASHISPPIAIWPVRRTSFQPDAGAPAGFAPRARSFETTTRAAREGSVATAASSASKRRPTTTIPPGVGATPSTYGRSPTKASCVTASAGRTTAGAMVGCVGGTWMSGKPLASTISRRSARRSCCSARIRGSAPRTRVAQSLRLVPSTTAGSCARSHASRRRSSSARVTTSRTEVKLAVTALSYRATTYPATTTPATAQSITRPTSARSRRRGVRRPSPSFTCGARPPGGASADWSFRGPTSASPR